jgi:hypothetical protein
MTTSGSEIYGEFIEVELKAENDRRDSVHTRAGVAVTSSAALITLVLGVFGFLVGKTPDSQVLRSRILSSLCYPSSLLARLPSRLHSRWARSSYQTTRLTECLNRISTIPKRLRAMQWLTSTQWAFCRLGVGRPERRCCCLRLGSVRSLPWSLSAPAYGWSCEIARRLVPKSPDL